MADTSKTASVSSQRERQICLSREAYDVYVCMQVGLGLVGIQRGLNITRAAVLSRQNNLEKLGIISKGSMDGQRRRILMTPDQFRVEPLHRATVKANLAAERAAADARFQAEWAAEHPDDAEAAALAATA